MQVNSINPIPMVEQIRSIEKINPVIEKVASQMSQTNVPVDVATVAHIAEKMELDNSEKIREIKEKIRDGHYNDENVVELIVRSLINGALFH